MLPLSSRALVRASFASGAHAWAITSAGPCVSRFVSTSTASRAPVTSLPLTSGLRGVTAKLAESTSRLLSTDIVTPIGPSGPAPQTAPATEPAPGPEPAFIELINNNWCVIPKTKLGKKVQAKAHLVGGLDHLRLAVSRFTARSDRTTCYGRS